MNKGPGHGTQQPAVRRGVVGPRAGKRDLHIQDARIAGRDLTVTGEQARNGGGVAITIGGFTYRPRPAALLATAVLATAVLLLAVLGLAALLGGR